MKYRTLYLALSALTLLAMPAYAQQAAPADTVDVFDYVANYEFGQSRAPLGVLEEVVRSADRNPFEKQAILKRFTGMITSPDVTLEGKRFIARQLALLAGPETLPALVPLLEDPQTADLALYVYERVPGPEANRILRDALVAQMDEKILIGIVNILGARGDGEAVPLLAQLAADPQPGPAIAAIKALGKIGDNASREALLKIWAEGPEALRNDTGAALLTLADKLAASGQLTLARTVYDTVLEKAEAAHLRAGALGGIAAVAPEEASPIIIDSFFSTDDGMRAAAAGLLRSNATEDMVNQLVARLGDLDDQGKVLLLRTLRDTGTRLPHEVLKDMVLNGTEPVQIAALQAIGAWGDEAYVDVLLRMSLIGERNLKEAARDSLRSLPAQGVNAYLVKVARSANADEAVEAIQTLAARKAVGAKESLLKLVESDNPNVRAEAWKALRSLSDDKDILSIVALLTATQDDGQRETAENVLASVIRRLEDRSPAAEVVVDAFQKADSDLVRASLLRVLGNVGADQALETINAALGGESETIRQAAIDALAGWPNSAPLKDLKLVAQQPKTEAERASAFAGLVRMLRSATDKRPVDLLAEYQDVMAVAATPAEKKAVLSGLSRVSAPDTFKLLDEYASDPALSAELNTARVQVAGVLAGAYPQLAREEMNALLQSVDDETIRNQAQQVIAVVEGLGDWLVAWQVSPAYFLVGQGGNMLFDDQFAPETDPASVAWSVMPVGLLPEQPFVLDLSRALGGAERMAYLRTEVTSPSAQDAVLELGSNDGIKAWVNGAVVHENNVGRPLTPNEDKIDVQLKEGVNTIMLGVYNMGGEWQATARLVGKDGQPLQGLKAAVPQ
ncbi:MAG: HEAT repeat domain-containing protein [Candidatus Hydrogenedentes bacterium]|nr:HEAT repeat domain-containing protein [Candidatus Hydrogenedentota bacterium]